MSCTRCGGTVVIEEFLDDKGSSLASKACVASIADISKIRSFIAIEEETVYFPQPSRQGHLPG
jgi:hypothetical protein